MIALLILVGGIGYYFNSKANKDMTSMYKERTLAIEADIYNIFINVGNSEEQNSLVKDIENRKYKVYKGIYLNDRCFFCFLKNFFQK